MSESDVLQANQSFYDALNGMLQGDVNPMRMIWSDTPEITDLGPFGGALVGFGAVLAEFENEAGMKLGGQVVPIDIHVVATTDMGYVVCTEQGENFGADGRAIRVEHRATNIFRREGGRWKMVHHHTDLAPVLQERAGGDVS